MSQKKRRLNDKDAAMLRELDRATKYSPGQGVFDDYLKQRHIIERRLIDLNVIAQQYYMLLADAKKRAVKP